MLEGEKERRRQKRVGPAAERLQILQVSFHFGSGVDVPSNNNNHKQ